VGRSRYHPQDCARRLCYGHCMGRAIDLLLSLGTAAAAALLLALIARDDVGMSADMVRVDALSAAGFIFAAVAGSSALEADHNG
jgi:hypothetical protein